MVLVILQDITRAHTRAPARAHARTGKCTNSQPIGNPPEPNRNLNFYFQINHVFGSGSFSGSGCSSPEDVNGFHKLILTLSRLTAIGYQPS